MEKRLRSGRVVFKSRNMIGEVYEETPDIPIRDEVDVEGYESKDKPNKGLRADQREEEEDQRDGWSSEIMKQNVDDETDFSGSV